MNPTNSVATKQDLNDLRDELKKELEKFATKDDLKNFATKDDLKNFATKDDLKNFITRVDAKDFARKKDVDKIAAQVAVNTVEIVDIKSELRGVHTKLDYLIEALSDIVGDLKDNQIERAATNLSLDRHQSMLENHEKRIRQLEQKPTRM